MQELGVRIAPPLWTNSLPQIVAAFVTVQLIKALEAARGNGTSMISLIMPPKDQVRGARNQQLNPGAEASLHAPLPVSLGRACGTHFGGVRPVHEYSVNL